MKLTSCDNGGKWEGGKRALSAGGYGGGSLTRMTVDQPALGTKKESTSIR